MHDGPAWFDVGARWSGLSWRYAPDAYVGLETNAGPLPRETLITIAEAVRFVDPYPARLPYRLDHLPADIASVHVTQHHPRYYSHVRLLSWERIRDTWREGLPDITVTDDPPDPGADWDAYWYVDLWRGERQPTTIAGRPARCSETRCDIDYGDYLVSLGVVGWPAPRSSRSSLAFSSPIPRTRPPGSPSTTRSPGGDGARAGAAARLAGPVARMSGRTPSWVVRMSGR